MRKNDYRRAKLIAWGVCQRPDGSFYELDSIPADVHRINELPSNHPTVHLAQLTRLYMRFDRPAAYAWEKNVFWKR